MITLTLTPEARAVLAQVQRFPERMATGLAASLDRENELSIGQIQRTRLSRRGPETLGVVTNRLRSSISRAPARLGEDGRTLVSAIGSNVEYAGAHEYGFRGTVPVRAHTRRRFETRSVGGATLDPRTGRIKKARKKTVREQSGIAQVRAHTRQVAIPERAYIRRTVEARAGAYEQSLSRAILRAWEAQPPA